MNWSKFYIYLITIVILLLINFSFNLLQAGLTMSEFIDKTKREVPHESKILWSEQRSNLHFSTASYNPSKLQKKIKKVKIWKKICLYMYIITWILTCTLLLVSFYLSQNLSNFFTSLIFLKHFGSSGGSFKVTSYNYLRQRNIFLRRNFML
jgi:hypothetical protein